MSKKLEVLLCCAVLLATGTLAYAGSPDWKSIFQQGVTSLENGSYDAADARLAEALKLAEASKNSEEIIATLSKLAELKMARYQFTEAAPVFERLIRLLREKHGAAAGQNSSFLESLNSLAAMYCDMKNFKRAAELYEEIVSADLKYKKRPLAEQVITLKGLAEVYRKAGALEKSRAYYQRVMAIDAMIRPADSLETASDWAAYGFACRKAKRYKQAEECYKKSLAIREKPRKEPRAVYLRRMIGSLDSLHKCYREAGELEKDAEVTQLLLKNMSELMGPNDGSNLEYLREYSKTLQKLGRTKDVAHTETRIKQILETVK